MHYTHLNFCWLFGTHNATVMRSSFISRQKLSVSYGKKLVLNQLSIIDPSLVFSRQSSVIFNCLRTFESGHAFLPLSNELAFVKWDSSSESVSKKLRRIEEFQFDKVGAVSQVLQIEKGFVIILSIVSLKRIISFKGPIKSELIYEYIDFPNYHLKSSRNICPESFEVEYL